MGGAGRWGGVAFWFADLYASYRPRVDPGGGGSREEERPAEELDERAVLKVSKTAKLSSAAHIMVFLTVLLFFHIGDRELRHYCGLTPVWVPRDRCPEGKVNT